MTWAGVVDVIGYVCVSLGTVFTCLAALGIVRFRHLLQRQHAGTKPQMLGFILLMVGVMVIERTAAWVSFGMLAIILQMVTAPLSSHILARAAYGREGVAVTGSRDEDRTGR